MPAKIEPSSTFSKPAPWAMVLLGTVGYLACGLAIHSCVVRQPDFNPVVQTSLIVALGLALLAAIEGLFHWMGITRSDDHAGWPYRAACLASIAYGVTYGPYVFINTWWFDDWGYLVWDESFSPGILTKVLNDHISPLLNLLIWATIRLFGLDYVGIALLQHGVFIVLLLAVAHLFWRASRDACLLVLFLATYASWPSHEDARTWLGGGFWLSASASLLMVYLLHAQTRLSDDDGLTPSALVVSLALACMTVFISSQTMLPVVFLLAVSAGRIAISRTRAREARRLAILAGLSLLPTACIFIGRALYVHRAGFDLSGLIDGALVRNVVIFFSVKVVLLPLEFLAAQTRLLPVALFALLFAMPIAWALKVLRDEYADAPREPEEWAARAGLLALGCAILAVLFVQIGAARSWGAGSVLTSYYVTLPLLAVWIAEFGAVATLLPRIGRLLPDRDWRRAGACLVALAIVVEVGLSFAFMHTRVPLSDRVATLQEEQRFVTRLGTAACSLAKSHPGKTIAWRTSYDLSADCPRCASIFGPPGFLHDGRDLLMGLAPLAARRACGEADAGRILGDASKAELRTDGGENEAVREFYRSYFKTR